MVLALFAVRLRGHYLAIASLGFAVIIHQILLNWISLTQGPLGIYAIPPPPAIAIPGLPAIDFRNPVALFYLVAAFTLLTYFVLDQIVRSPIGETLTAIREDEISAASLGVNAIAWKVFAFGVGAAVGGAAGCFYATFVGTLVPDAFFITESFTILSMVIVGGMGTLIGPVFGAHPAHPAARSSARRRRPAPGRLWRGADPGRAVHARRTCAGGAAGAHEARQRVRAGAMTAAPARAAHDQEAAQPVIFQAKGLHKSFGGVRAVRDISFDVPAGAVFAIIGPNGAGKSTLLNLMSGVYQPDAGSLTFEGADLSGLPAHRRVRLGIARTFQKIRLFKQLSVLDNVVAGFHIHHEIPAWQYLIHGPAFRRDHARCRAEAMELLAFVGLASRHDTIAASLSYGEQRLLEFARALATKPRLLLVDEPAAGLNAAEVDSLLDRIKTTRERGVTVVVVEHNMDLVMNVADRVLVMDYGQHLFEGVPEEVQRSPAVVAAYLGGELM